MFVDLFCSVLEFCDDSFFLSTLTDFSFLSTEALDFLNCFLHPTLNVYLVFFRKLVFNFGLWEDNFEVHVSSSMFFSSKLQVSLSNFRGVEGIFQKKNLD